MTYQKRRYCNLFSNVKRVIHVDILLDAWFIWLAEQWCAHSRFSLISNSVRRDRCIVVTETTGRVCTTMGTLLHCHKMWLRLMLRDIVGDLICWPIDVLNRMELWLVLNMSPGRCKINFYFIRERRVFLISLEALLEIGKDSRSTCLTISVRISIHHICVAVTSLENL